MVRGHLRPAPARYPTEEDHAAITRPERRTARDPTQRNPPTIWDMTVNGFSQISVAEAGRLAFLSGQVAAPDNGEPVPRDIASQAQMAAANLSAALDELAASAADIVMVRIYVVDATTDRFQEALSGIRPMLGDEMPSVTTIGVQALYTPDIQLEIEMVVRVP